MRTLLKLILALMVFSIVWYVFLGIDLPVGRPEPERNADEPAAGFSPVLAELANIAHVPSDSAMAFDLRLHNRSSRRVTVYAVVYARNDRTHPPRRSAWPLGGLLFGRAHTREGQLAPSDIQRDWKLRPLDTKGVQVVLAPHRTQILPGQLPLNRRSPHPAWAGQPLDPGARHTDWWLWVFSEDGRLLLNQHLKLR